MDKNNLFIEILPEKQKKIFVELAGKKWLKNFYLAGGTSLALQIGHRESIDFDFFSNQKFNTTNIIQDLEQIGKFELFSSDKDTINGQLNDVQVSFFFYKYNLVNELLDYENINLASKLDIALMKLEAIASRGNKKDFIDLHFLLKEFDLEELYLKYHLKYGKGLDNKYHLLKSLAYFSDADNEPMPKMHVEINWEAIKADILEKVRALEKKILK
ncbi:MAG: nucleotidyl transferase AbiEii/AbiGii toxin family protein [Patescibacteria group bacterium]|nr:nucleotidyl transferase AbiEii/AbiGii toxin family protein [Patescibacteria group bacterium]